MQAYLLCTFLQRSRMSWHNENGLIRIHGNNNNNKKSRFRITSSQRIAMKSFHAVADAILSELNFGRKKKKTIFSLRSCAWRRCINNSQFYMNIHDGTAELNWMMTFLASQMNETLGKQRCNSVFTKQWLSSNNNNKFNLHTIFKNSKSIWTHQKLDLIRLKNPKLFNVLNNVKSVFFFCCIHPIQSDCFDTFCNSFHA